MKHQKPNPKHTDPVQITTHIFLATGSHPRMRFDYVLHITSATQLDGYYREMHQQILEDHRILLYGRRAMFVVVYYYLHRLYTLYPELRSQSHRVLTRAISFVSRRFPHVQYTPDDMRELRDLETALKNETHVHFS